MVTAPVSSCFAKMFQDTGLSVSGSFLECWAAGKSLVSLNTSASSNCRVNSTSTIGHDTSNAECRIAGTWGVWSSIGNGDRGLPGKAAADSFA